MFSKMAAHLFNESGQMQEVDIPDIFDVLEGGEDESAVKFLLGFNGDDNPGDDGSGLTISTGSPELMNNNGLVHQVLNSSPLSSPTLVEKTSTPARVVVQIEPPTGLANSVVTTPGGTLGAATSGGGGGMGASDQSKTDKPRRREPVDPSRCIYACDSCGKAFTTKFNLKRHINMHCSRSREAGVPIQGPPSASQPSRKHKSKESTGSVASESTSTSAASSQIKVRRVSSSNSNVVTSSTTTRSLNATSVSVVTSPPNLVKTVTNVGSATVGKTIVTASNPGAASTYQSEQPTGQPMTVQLAVNAAGQPRILTTSGPAKPATLPVQPLPESAVQLIQSLNSGSGPGTHRIVRIINAPQIIATQSRGGITTGATVQLQAIPVTVGGNANTAVTGNGTSISLPTQPIPLVQTVGTRQIVLTNAANSTSLTRMAHRVADIMPGIAATALDSAQKVGSTPVGLVSSSGSASATLVTNSASSADVLYRSILTPNSPNLTTLTPVTSTTISSPTGGLNCEQPPADLFDSEDGDALSVATTTETPTPPPSLNGDPIAAIKSLPTEKDLEMNNPNMGGVATKVVVIQQPPQLCPPPSEDDEDEDMTNSDPHGLTNTASLLPSNRFHGTLTSIPKGWLRKVVTTSKGFQQVFYYNPVGKRFSNQDEVDQYFARLGYSVPTHLFNFELPKLVDEDEDLDDIGSDPEMASDDGSTSAVVVKVTSNAKGEATVTPTTSTVVALPSGTIVTRADTTVGVDHLSGGPTSAISPTSGSLVTSSKQTLLSSASAAKIMLAKTST